MTLEQIIENFDKLINNDALNSNKSLLLRIRDKLNKITSDLKNINQSEAMLETDIETTQQFLDELENSLNIESPSQSTGNTFSNIIEKFFDYADTVCISNYTHKEIIKLIKIANDKLSWLQSFFGLMPEENLALFTKLLMDFPESKIIISSAIIKKLSSEQLCFVEALKDLKIMEPFSQIEKIEIIKIISSQNSLGMIRSLFSKKINQKLISYSKELEKYLNDTSLKWNIKDEDFLFSFNFAVSQNLLTPNPEIALTYLFFANRIGNTKISNNILEKIFPNDSFFEIIRRHPNTAVHTLTSGLFIKLDEDQLRLLMQHYRDNKLFIAALKKTIDSSKDELLESIAKEENLISQPKILPLKEIEFKEIKSPKFKKNAKAKIIEYGIKKYWEACQRQNEEKRRLIILNDKNLNLEPLSNKDELSNIMSPTN